MSQKLLVCLLLGVLVVFLTGAAINRPPVGTSRSTFTRGPSGVRAARHVGSLPPFYYPNGAAVDAAGNVYVVDLSTIHKVSPTGKVSLLVGNAEHETSYDSLDLDGPTGIAVDAAGTVYVADAGNQLIRKISPAGVVSTLAGQWERRGTADGVGQAARFEWPTGVAVDAAGTVYVVDQYNNTVRKISPAGRVSTLAGQANRYGFTDGPGHSALFNGPTGIAVDAAGTVYVADAGNHRIRKISPQGVVSTLAGIATLAEIGSGEFAMLMLGAQGSADGSATTARFNRPTGVAVDAAGTVYVADSENNTIRKISPAGEVSTLAGAPHTGGSRDGTGAAARFDGPYGVAVDAAGTVYVCDTGNHRLRTVSPTGVVRTLAGSGPAVSEERPPHHRH